MHGNPSGDGGSAHNDLSTRERPADRGLSGGLDNQLFAAGPWSAFQVMANLP